MPGQELGGRVISLGQVDPLTNLQTVRIAVANPRGALKTGAFATAEIIVRTDRQAVVVPKSAVLQKEEKQTVFVVAPDGVAHETTVTTGAEQGTNIEITRGVTAGQKVVTQGSYTLSDGAKVTEASSGGEGGEKPEAEKKPEAGEKPKEP